MVLLVVILHFNFFGEFEEFLNYKAYKGLITGVDNIINRAENNLTAKVFVTLFNSVRPFKEVLTILGLEEREYRKAKIELFWKGFRDYALENKDCREKFLDCYRKIIPEIRNAVKGTKLHTRDNFYTEHDPDKLFNELRNTEIDVAVFTPNRICLGEAKRKEKLGFNGRNILAHQFIRQRVMVEILKALTGDRREVISFIICDRSKIRSLSRMEQVKALGLLDGQRPLVISWQDILALAQELPGIWNLQREVEMILSVD